MVPPTADTGARTSFLRTYGFALTSTLLIWSLVAWQGGLQDTLLVITLTVLEVTFSFDNAIVNSRLLKVMSAGWQLAFMTVGIFIAVFVVRFALPIFIVQLTTDLSFTEVISLAFNDPLAYGLKLTEAGPMIDAFGGTFLVMIGISWLFDEKKEVHWFAWLERKLAPLGRYDNVTIFLIIVGALVMYFTAPGELAVRATVIVAALFGIALHVGLDLFGSIAGGEEDGDDEAGSSPSTRPNKAKVLIGAAAAVMFARLEVLDASYSFDGVVGAFAITSSVLVIMAGLGAGAVWVRAMTVHLLRAGTLAKFKYLEHAAMWAILLLGLVMLGKLYHLHLPEWGTGSIGLVLITLGVVTSKIAEKREERLAAITKARELVSSGV